MSWLKLISETKIKTKNRRPGFSQSPRLVDSLIILNVEMQGLHNLRPPPGAKQTDRTLHLPTMGPSH